jgi:predicted permease
LPIDPHPSLPVLGFAFLLSLLTGVIFGIVPAWITSHADPAEALRGVNRSTRDRASLPQQWLIVFQATLSVVLLMGAGLLTRSLANLQSQDLGLETANRYVVHLDPLAAGYTAATVPAMNQALTERFQSLPEVANVGLALYSPLERDEWSEDVFIAGRPAPSADVHNGVLFDRVNPQYFAAIGEHLVRGRVFSEDDTSTSQAVAIVNEAFVQRYFPHENPVGRFFGSEDPKFAHAFQIVGVVANAKYGTPSETPLPMFFRPLTQEMAGLTRPSEKNMEARSRVIGAIVLQFRTPPQNVDALVRQTLAGINPNLTVTSLHTFSFQVDGNLNQNRLLSRLSMLFGALALVLATIGIYGVTSYQVSRRTNEIGVRMALGATRESMLKMVLREAFRKVTWGLAIGIPSAVGGARLIQSQLYNVKSYDPLSLLVAVTALIFATALAAAIPAARAANIEPMIALRTD